MSDLGKDVSTVLANVNILNLLDEHLQVGKGGVSQSDYTCPFHKCDDKPDDGFSLAGRHLATSKPDWFKCFACGAHGNAIDFLMQYHHYTLEAAVAVLMKRVEGKE
jgi:DNA primase